MVLAPTLILAIDDFRLFRMQRQSAFRKPRRKSSPQCCGLVFITTVTDRIIGIALEQYVREVPAHPQIERIGRKRLARRGLMTPPCGVPLSRPMRLPSAICIGAFSHLSMYKSAHGQSVCLRTARISSSGSMLSKNTTTHYPSPRLPTFGDNPPPAASLRGLRSSSAERRAPPRRSIAAGRAPRRQPHTDPSGVDRFGGNARRRTRGRD